jgi:4-amino-4-deoxy-L-arabinose transferase-like glycosyltransferase
MANLKDENSLAGARWRALIWVLILLGAGVLRVSRFQNAPRPYGYVYDLYHQGIQVFFEKGRAPRLEDGWECYHPPFFYALGVPFYVAGGKYYHRSNPELSYREIKARALKFVLVMPALCGLWIIWWCWRILRLLRQRGWRLLLAMAVVLCFPCLFITAGGIDGDILLAALMVTLFYYLLRYYYEPKNVGLVLPVIIGIVTGLAMGTKYSGLLGLLIAGEVVGLRLLQGPFRSRRVCDGLIILLLALAIGSWKYVDNMRRYGTPLKANAEAYDIGMPGQRSTYLNYYEFFTLRMGSLLDLMNPERAQKGKLSFLPVYRSVWTTLHAMAWGDMSFFNEPTRFGGAAKYGYESRNIPSWLSSSVLWLGLVANAVALIGMIAVSHRKLLFPLTVMVLTTMLFYFLWVINAKHWQLKTKYILFLLPAYVLYLSYGAAWLQRRVPRMVWGVIVVAFATLIGLTHAYLYHFAAG